MDAVKMRQLAFELENDPNQALQKVQSLSRSQQQAILNFLKNFGSDILINQLLPLFMKYKIILNDAPQRQANSMRLLYLRDHEYEWYLTFEQLHKIMVGQSRVYVTEKQNIQTVCREQTSVVINGQTPRAEEQLPATNNQQFPNTGNTNSVQQSQVTSVTSWTSDNSNLTENASHEHDHTQPSTGARSYSTQHYQCTDSQHQDKVQAAADNTSLSQHLQPGEKSQSANTTAQHEEKWPSWDNSQFSSAPNQADLLDF